MTATITSVKASEPLPDIDSIDPNIIYSQSNIKPMTQSTNVKSNVRIINTDNLSVGMVIKNYKVLCELLEQETVDGGHNRKLQMKEWHKYFDWEKDKQKFIITDIYITPLPKAIREGTTYAHLIETLLVAFLSNQEDWKFETTETEIFQILKMVNSRFANLKDSKTYTALTDVNNEHSVMPISYVDFSATVHRRLRGVLHDALRSMCNRMLLSYRSETIFCIGKERYIATDDQVKAINAVGRKVLKEMNADNIFQIYARNQTAQYYEKINNTLFTLYGWTKVYKRLVLIYTQNQLTDAIDRTKTNLLRAANREDILINEKKLNEAIALMLEKETQRKIDTWRKKRDEYIKAHEGWGEVRLPKNLKKGQFVDSPQYLYDQRFLIDYFIKID